MYESLRRNNTSANMAFMSWSEITGMHLISWKGNRVVDISIPLANMIHLRMMKDVFFLRQILDDDLIIASDPVFIDGDVFRIEQLAAWTVFSCKYYHWNYHCWNYLCYTLYFNFRFHTSE